MDFPDLTLGPTNLPERLKKHNPELEMLYRALRKADQEVLDRFFEAIQQHQAAMDIAENMLPPSEPHGSDVADGGSMPPRPMESILLFVQLEERKWLRHELNELNALVERLKKEVEELKQKRA